MNGNALGPVLFLCLGVFLGYLALTGRSAQLVALLSGQSGSTTSNTVTTTLPNGMPITNTASVSYGG